MNLTREMWTDNDYRDFVTHLKSLADEKYREFHSSLIPESDSEILGVRMPVLRDLGKQIAKGNARSFLGVAKSSYYEERMLKGIVTGLVKSENYADFITLFERFIPEIDSWAVCDCFCAGLKEVKRYSEEFFDYIGGCLKSENPWKIRTALVLMLDYYLDEGHIDEALRRVDSVKNDFYYVKMAQAWLISIAFVKCRDKTERYLLNNCLPDDVFNKAIQKCVESRRIDENTKEYLKSLKRR